MKKITIIFVVCIMTIGTVYGLNYFKLNYPVNKEIKSDDRDSGINIDVHYEYYINSGILIFNLEGFPEEKTKADIFRSFLQSAQALKESSFDTVKLAFNDNVKFLITGLYFKQLGNEYESQNPIYTIRTFPENVLTVQGSPAYGHVEGGILGVLGAEMDDFSDFFDKWVLKN